MFTAVGENLARGTQMLAQVIAAPVERRGELAKQVSDCEHAGDELTHTILRRLNATFVTPFDRSDIYSLASHLDDVMDLVEEAADALVLYAIGDLPRQTTALVDVLVKGSERTAAAMGRLRDLGGLEEYWIEINELENSADRIYRSLKAELFSGKYDALEVLKLQAVIDRLEDAADALEHVANTVETISVKEG
jgi:predicted phosphate transport protein (TIGR00153 family)